MDTRVYYGEYTLRYWINLMLTKNIELPDYQRSFVWDEDDIRRMMSSLESGQFVPPVTIAHFDDGQVSRNLILDGQQRLTSLLLVYLGYMPNKEIFTEPGNDLAVEDDSDEEDSKSALLEWTYKLLLRDIPKDNTLEQIINRLRRDNRYRKLDDVLSKDIEEFYDNTFLGFSFIIPNCENVTDTNRYFSTLFRNLNYLGRKLSPLESRRSLYFLNDDYKNFFEGKFDEKEDVLCHICIMEKMKSRKLDFVRYLSTLSQYVGDNEAKKILRGYSSYSSRENFYADYVSYIVGLEQNDRKDKFDSFKMETVFPNFEWRERFRTVKEFLENNKEYLGLDEKTNAFKSWIDADYWLYGLLYYVVFKGMRINNHEELITSISEEISKKKTDNGDYSKNPNRIGNLRERIIRSIEIYKNYAE